MRLGILQTGKINEALAGRFDEYPAMFARLFRAADPSVGTRAYAVVDGELPESPAEADAWLVTGSRHGVYDGLPWIEPLKEFLRRARADGVPEIGVCFGHQVMAEAFGGRVEKFAGGWCCGVQEYELHRPAGWMQGAPAWLALHGLHQDQVTAIPDDATCIASTPFCRYAMLAYGDPEAPDAISIQPHPEFDEHYMRAVIERLAGTSIPRQRAEAGLATLGAPVAGHEFARWTLAWLRQALADRAAA